LKIDRELRGPFIEWPFPDSDWRYFHEQPECTVA
jgi:hypothetical protein